MKRIVLSLCCLTIVFSLCSCTQEGVKPSAALNPTTEQTSASKSNTTGPIIIENKSMPEPFASSNETCVADDRDGYYNPYNVHFYSIDNTLIHLVGPERFDAWIKEFAFEGGDRDQSEFSILSFVKEFGISKQAFLDAMEENTERARKNGITDLSVLYTPEQIDAIYAEDQTIINQVFVSDFSILKDGKIYTPEWLYTHSVEEYEAEGLDPQQVRSRISLYENIPFTLEAEEAFSDKLRAFTGQGLETEAPIPPAETTPAPPMAINAETTPLPEGFDPSLFDESPAESAPSTTDGSMVGTEDDLQ